MNLVAQYTAVRFDVTLNYADGRPSFTKNVAYKGKYNFVNDANETAEEGISSLPLSSYPRPF